MERADVWMIERSYGVGFAFKPLAEALAEIAESAPKSEP